MNDVNEDKSLSKQKFELFMIEKLVSKILVLSLVKTN